MCIEHCALANLLEYQLLNKQVEATSLQRKMEIGKNLPDLDDFRHFILTTL